MANHNCNGDYFSVGGVRFYRCLWDGSLVLPAPDAGRECPHCRRPIDGAEDHGERRLFTRHHITLRNGWEVEVPDPSTTKPPEKPERVDFKA